MRNAQNSLGLDLFAKQTLHVSKAGSGRRRRQLSLRRVCVALAGQGQAANAVQCKARKSTFSLCRFFLNFFFSDRPVLI